jgi:predicted CoA-binding protein
MQNVAIIGASPKPGRYARKAQEMLDSYGHKVFPVSNKTGDILGVPSYQSVSDIAEPIDTVTLYVRPEYLEKHTRAIREKGVKRVIFNPGTESEIYKAEFESAGIEVVEGCTLVMLSTDQFE